MEAGGPSLRPVWLHIKFKASLCYESVGEEKDQEEEMIQTDGLEGPKCHGFNFSGRLNVQSVCRYSTH